MALEITSSDMSRELRPCPLGSGSSFCTPVNSLLNLGIGVFWGQVKALVLFVMSSSVS